MDSLISEVRCCLENKLYLAALALALIVPDVCGAKENSGKQVKSYDRYVTWFEKWVAPEYMKLVEVNEEDEICFEKKSPYFFTGDACYSLRCSFLHEGSSDVKRKGADKGSSEVADYQLRLVLGGSDGYGYIEHRCGEAELNEIYNVTINIVRLCQSICSGAEKSYETRKNLDSIKQRPVYVDLEELLYQSQVS